VTPAALGRSGFDLPPEEIYLDGAYMSPHPRTARAAVEEAYRQKAEPWRFRYTDGIDQPDAVREKLSRVLGFPAGEMTLTTSATEGFNRLAHGIRWEPGDRVLLGPDEFPCNVYPWNAARARGLTVEFLGERGRPLTPATLSAALARPGRVRVVSIAAMHYVTGELHPLADFARLAHEAGALFATDATQVTGAVSLEWPSLGLDALCTSAYKWLFGPYGAGAVWIRPSVRDELIDVAGNFWAAERGREVSAILDYTPSLRHGRRLDSGETASFLNLAAFGAGLDYVFDAGVARLEAHHRSLQDRLCEGLEGGPIRPVTSRGGARRSPVFFFATPESLDPEKLRFALAERHVRVSLRGGRLRVSPGAWSEASDVDALAEALAAIVR
jgi:selenocysteine lyase/cysteine desulfurase